MRKSAASLFSLLAVVGSLLLMPAANAATVSVKVSTTTVDIGKPVTVSGKATNADPGDLIKIQVRKPGTTRWVTVKRVALKATHKYSTKIRLATPGANKVRVKSGKLASPSLTVTAYAWLDLTKQPHMQYSGSLTFMGATVQLGGTSYTPSIFAGGSADYLWNVDPGVCTNVKLTLGRPEDFGPPTGTFASSLQFFSDGPSVVHPYFVDGAPVPVAEAVPASTLQVYFKFSDFTLNAYAAAGTPMIRCAAASLPEIDPTDAPF
ncbi:MAG TPA: hypothetical protein VLI04_09105 [Nocardioidaceae bacterium]|nr:hypothetical protein [Nocardioidaceae bacterium]